MTRLQRHNGLHVVVKAKAGLVKKRFGSIALKLFIAAAYGFSNNSNAQDANSQLKAEIIHIRSLAPPLVQSKVSELIKQVGALPDGPGKIYLSLGLSAVVAEKDVSQDTLQAIARMFDQALLAAPPKDPLDSLANYKNLATFIHFKHVHIELHDPKLTRELAILDANTPDLKHADFTLNDLHGMPVTLSGLRGNIVLVNFWATWCGPCVQELYDLDVIQSRFRSQGVIVLALTNESRPKIEAFLKRTPHRERVLLDTGGHIARQFDVGGIPHTFVFDRKGRFVTDEVEQLNETELKQMLNQAGLAARPK
jgi:peroxiredoxin